MKNDEDTKRRLKNGEDTKRRLKNGEDTKRRLKNGEDKQSRRQLVETESTGVADLGVRGSDFEILEV
nr:hypothetical protein CFP56_46562 [Quercus suber]